MTLSIAPRERWTAETALSDLEQAITVARAGKARLIEQSEQYLANRELMPEPDLQGVITAILQNYLKALDEAEQARYGSSQDLKAALQIFGLFRAVTHPFRYLRHRRHLVEAVERADAAYDQAHRQLEARQNWLRGENGRQAVIEKLEAARARHETDQKRGVAYRLRIDEAGRDIELYDKTKEALQRLRTVADSLERRADLLQCLYRLPQRVEGGHIGASHLLEALDHIYRARTREGSLTIISEHEIKDAPMPQAELITNQLGEPCVLILGTNADPVALNTSKAPYLEVELANELTIGFNVMPEILPVLAARQQIQTVLLTPNHARACLPTPIEIRH